MPDQSYTGIAVESDVEGWISLFEEYSAMVASNFNEVEWEALEPTVKARAVAFFRLKNIVEIHEGAILREQARIKSNLQKSAGEVN